MKKNRLTTGASLKPKKLKPNKEVKPLKPVFKGNPCQSKPVDFHQLFVEDHKNYAELSKLYLQKIGDMEKRSAVSARKCAKLNSQVSLLKKQLNCQMASTDQIVNKYDLLEKENVELRSALSKLEKLYLAKLENQNLKQKKEDIVKANYYEEKTDELRSMYRKLIPLTPGLSKAQNYEPVQQANKSKNRSDFASTADNFNSTKYLGNTFKDPYFMTGDLGLDRRVGDIRTHNSRMRASSSNYKF